MWERSSSSVCYINIYLAFKFEGNMSHTWSMRIFVWFVGVITVLCLLVIMNTLSANPYMVSGILYYPFRNWMQTYFELPSKMVCMLYHNMVYNSYTMMTWVYFCICILFNRKLYVACTFYTMLCTWLVKTLYRITVHEGNAKQWTNVV